MILGEVPVAPLIVEVPWAAIGLGIFCTYIVLFGLKKAYHNTLGAVLNALADLLTVSTRFFSISLAGPLDALNHRIERFLAAGLAATETALGKWWHGQEKIARWTWDATLWFANSTVGAFDAFVNGTLPDTVNLTIQPVKQSIGRVMRAIKWQAHHAQVQLTKTARALEAQLDHDFGLAWRGIDALQVDLRRILSRELRGIEADIHTIENKVGHIIPRRLSRLERLLASGVLGGVAIAALTRVFPYWQCSNTRRFMRGVCRMPPGLINDLLGAGVTVLALSDLCLMARSIGQAAEAFAPVLTELVLGAGALTACAGIEAPPPMPLHTTALPTVEGLTALPGF